MILFVALKNLINSFYKDKSYFKEMSNEILQEFYKIEVDTNSKCFEYQINWYTFIICDGKIIWYQYLKGSTNIFEMDDIMNNDIEYNILKYGKILSEEI